MAWKKPGVALSLLLLTAAGMFLSGLIYYDGEVVDEGFVIFLLPVFLIPITICIVHWGPSSSQLERPWYKAVTGFILAIVKYLFILAIFIVVFQFFSPVLFAIFVMGSYQWAQARKYGLAVDIISTVAMCIRQSLPLPMALATAAHGKKKKDAAVFNNIAHWLTQGWPLSESLRRGYPKCPSEILASISTAEKMDQLPRAIESLQKQAAEKMRSKKIEKSDILIYPTTVLTVAFFIMMGLAIFIVPTFSEVLLDMSDGKASLPFATQSLLDFSSWMMQRDGLNALLFVLPVFLFMAFKAYLVARKRRPEKPRLLSRLGDRIKWCTPVLHWFEKTFANIYLSQTLHAGITAGYPVNTTIRNAIGLDVNRCYQKRLEKWLDQIEAGNNIAQSAKACGLDKKLCWAMDEKMNKGSTPQILGSLEMLYRCQYNYRKNVLIAATEPLMILCLGLCVGYVVLAMFMGVFSTITVTLQYTIPQ
ncbi:MAG: type II secretion system F family protein [Phycisphaerae bacterium]|nr:type II secretion system F family protein [Phycisphaerae bacterium]